MPQIVTVDDLRIYLGHEGYEEKINPELLVRSIDSAETWIKNYTGRRFYADPAFEDDVDSADPVTKSFTVRGRGWVRIPDLRTETEVSINGSVLTADVDYVLDDYNSDGEPHTSIQLVSLSPWTNPFTLSSVTRLSITGRWGFVPVPDDVKDSILALAARQYRRKDAMFSDVIDMGNVSFEYTKGVPNFITDILDLYKMPRVAVA